MYHWDNCYSASAFKCKLALSVFGVATYTYNYRKHFLWLFYCVLYVKQKLFEDNDMYFCNFEIN